MIDARALSAMVPGSVLVNTARGEIVDLDAVHSALRDGKLDGFAADVLPVEPPDREHPLIRAYAAGEPWTSGRVVLSPHAAFYSEDCERDLREKSARAVLDALLGRPLRNCINLAALRAASVTVPEND
jgi:phosphoglycerate dehydrogenase-like enzyme